MNSHIELLHCIAQKSTRIILGLMSGTSLDGLDIALCKIEGNGENTKLQLLNFKTVPYDIDIQNSIRTVFSKQQVNLEQLTLLNEWMGKLHALLINQTLKEWNIANSEVDIIASHGQTVYHAPVSLHQNKKLGNGTLQIGDGDHIAVLTGIITLSDFRQKHIAAGGEGAPLAAYGDYLLFKEKERDVILLNIGGISNFTFLPSNDEGIFSSDVGPGNTLMDAWMQKNFTHLHFDKDAAVAKKGMVNDALLNSLFENEFLQTPVPKTTGPELFNLSFVEAALQKIETTSISVEDVMATLNFFTAKTIANTINEVIQTRTIIYVSGGGLHNPMLMDHLKHLINNAEILSTLEKGINPDAKEAILFALLANEAVAGNPEKTFPKGLKNFPAVSMGKISFTK
ncbi:MAG TPA: anhydro-N-acetylmuramic acid kinase [Ferruginibacter sp.]|nr:anhydro-N-acetylmuramic acid kinase [Ferruginibacter sp.]